MNEIENIRNAMNVLRIKFLPLDILISLYNYAVNPSILRYERESKTWAKIAKRIENRLSWAMGLHIDESEEGRYIQRKVW